MDNADLLRRLLATFRVEGEERLKAMSMALLALEQQPDARSEAEIVEGLFREAHSLKGAARAVNLVRIESLCQALEGVLAQLKRGHIEPSTALFELLNRTLDTLVGMLEPAAEAATEVDGLIVQLGRASSGSVPGRPSERSTAESITPAPFSDGAGAGAAAAEEQTEREAGTRSSAASDSRVPPPARPNAPVSRSGPVLPGRSAGSTVRISVEKTEALMRQVEALLAPRLAAAELASELRETTNQLVDWRKRRTRIQSQFRQAERKSPSVKRELQELQPLLEYLDDEQGRLKLLEERLARLTRTAERDQRQLAALVKALDADAKELQMMPCSSLLEMFPRLVRELSREQGKEVRLDIGGAEIEVDRRMLEEMRDPLTHLLRNAVDHGIETPDVRRERQKPAAGIISITIEQRDSNKIELRLTDDGSGVDIERLRAAVAELGVIDADALAAMEEQALLEFSFQSGVSTSPLITDLSGRGLGLTIVREKVEQLGGTVEVSSGPGKGTGFRIVLPLTLATFNGLLIRVAGRQFVLPAASVERALRFSESEIRTVENRDTIVVDGTTLALVRLDTILGLASDRVKTEAAYRQAVILGGAGRIAFDVDEIVGEQEVLIKPLGPQLARVANISGATVLGNGRVVPVLNVPDLLQSATLTTAAMRRDEGAATAERPPGSILVVEDSITSRSLLKGILESAGYRVATAVDGIDAFTALRTEPVDLLVSDIDMPRMNGLALTAKVRADDRLADLPVILVTSLSSAEDRERGVEVGANAYIVKSSFDQSSLLDAVQRLIG